MGLFADTLADATRPLPRATLRRMADASPPSYDEPELQDEGETLTVYRLQKDGGREPPAPPAPRAVDAAAKVQGPLHAPVGDFDVDASLQFVTSIDGLETGEEQASLRTVGVTDEQEQLVSPDSLHRFHYGVANGSSVASNLAPSPLVGVTDEQEQLVSPNSLHRFHYAVANGSSVASNLAPSPLVGVTDEQGQLVSPDSLHRFDYGVAKGSSVASNLAPSPLDQRGDLVSRIDSSDGMRRATGRGAPSGDPRNGDPTPATPPPAVTASAMPTAAVSATTSADAAGAILSQAMLGARPASPADTAPRLSIGRIEVTVLSAPQAARAPNRPADDGAFLSRHYLRRL